ncbi:polysaccharide biosynthesis protein [Sesbania bispinosa]|nr:polysaccharide biosynthesis protein [Sesbania bispinosa]
MVAREWRDGGLDGGDAVVRWMAGRRQVTTADWWWLKDSEGGAERTRQQQWNSTGEEGDCGCNGDHVWWSYNG